MTLGPLVLLPLASLLLYRAGHRHDAWVIPVALGLLWLLARGYAQEPTYLATVGIFVVAAVAAEAFEHRRSGAFAPTRSSLQTVPAITSMADPFHAAIAAPRSIPLRLRPTRPPAAPANERRRTPRKRKRSGDRARTPADGGDLLSRIEHELTEVQRSQLLGPLRSPAESVALLRASVVKSSAAQLAQAKVSDRRPWGDRLEEGLLVAFEGYAPADATVLVVLADVADPLAQLPVSQRDSMRGTALLVPTDLPGVKRLTAGRDTSARWIARAVFVPSYLLVGEARGGEGPGRGERITGRPS